MITLQFSNDDSAASWAIQAYGHGWPSHVDAVLPDGTLLGARDDVCGGVPAGVQIRPAGYAAFKQTQVVTLDTSISVDDFSGAGTFIGGAKADAFYTFLTAQLGKPYDQLAIAAFPFDQDWTTKGAWFCSELIAAALEVSRWFPKPLSRGTNKISPAELLLVLSAWDVS